MATVTTDLIDGSEIIDSSDGVEAVRVFFVDGLVGNAAIRMATALVTTGIPIQGEAHPGITSLVVVRRRAFMRSFGQARVECLYKRPTVEEAPPSAPAQIHIGGAVNTTETSFDVFGNLIETEYEIVGVDADGTQTFTPDFQTGQVTFQEPQTLARLTRRETITPTELLAKSNIFQGTTNNAPFLNEAARTWLCTRVEGDSDDDGLTFLVTYEFQFKRNTWDAEIFYKDIDTGLPPFDLVAGVGFKSVVVLPLANFSILGL